MPAVHLKRSGSILLCCAFLLTWICHAWGDSPEIPSPRTDPLIQKIVSQISEERVEAIMRKLESFETRNTLSDPSQTNRGIGVARQWIFDQFKSYSPDRKSTRLNSSH